MVGRTISHYRVLARLGAGGMGVVYRAHDDRLDRDVALKVLPRDMLADETARARLLREARLASKLNHPNICTIHEVGEADGQAYIAMELVEGQTLSARLAGGPLPVEDVVRYGQQLARALAHAHERGVVHRDLKSGNIIITGDAGVKVLDFGLAKRMDGERPDAEADTETALTAPGAITGTPAYMAPEQLRGEPADARSDIWALGVVLYEMTGGRRPFEGKSSFELVAAILSGALAPLPASVPGPLKAVINRCLAQAPEDRYPRAADVAAALQAAAPEAAASLNVRQLVRRLRRPRVAIPVAAGIVAVIAFAIWFVDRQAKIRWAKEEALPQIEKLVADNDVWRELVPAYRLAEKAEAYIPRDPRLAELMAKCSLKIDVTTEPPGAKVYFKEYRTPDAEWSYLGVTPLRKIRMPIGIFRFKMDKDGYEPVLGASSTWDIDPADHNIIVPYTIARVLDKTGSVPAGMVRVREADNPGSKGGAFFMDKYEVTNRQYKEFVNGGGYRNRQYWKQPFISDGRELTWEEGIAALVDQTGQPGPATWQGGDYPEGQADYPVSGVSWYEAAAYAEYAGKSLPPSNHWARARGGQTPLVTYGQLGGNAVFAPFSNFTRNGPAPVGSLAGISVFGAFDMGGNVREWCWNETPKGRAIRGGAWGENIYMVSRVEQAPPMDRSPKNGFRCALYPDRTKVRAAAFQPIKLGSIDGPVTQPVVPDSVFAAYKEQFSYDRTDLKPRVEERQKSPGGWIREKISIDAAYGGERLPLYVFLPGNAKPPYQTVVYFPGTASATQRSSKDIETYYEFPMFLSYVVRSGRAAVYPMYKGTFERGGMTGVPLIGADSHQFSEYLVQLVKDLRRSVDYLETREDVDSHKLAYLGMSWGAALGPVATAVETRFGASVLIGLSYMQNARPEVHNSNYVTRVRVPTLMLGGKYDAQVDGWIEQVSGPLGTAPKDKSLKLYDTDHIPPRTEMIKETLAWLDRYLGPVK